MISKYLDFELKVYVEGGQIEIDIDGRPFGYSLPERLKIPFCLAPVSYYSLTQNPANIADAGHSLFESVFCEEVKTAFASYLNSAKEFEGVRVCIQTPSNVLSESIWEILCDKINPSVNFLALDPKTPIIRTPRTGWLGYDRDLQAPLRMLIVLASPRLLQKIKPDEEKASLESALKDAVEQGLIDIAYLGFDEPTEANFDTLQEHLANQMRPYDVVHIIGHGLLEAGMEGKVALVQEDDGKMQSVNASSLANLFRSRRVILVVLQSCQSGAVDSSATSFSGVAQLLVASGVPAVLAMQGIIDQDVAQDFIGKLYKQWISSGSRFEDALTQARQSVFQKYQARVAPWAIPVLYIVPGFQLVLKPPASPHEPRPQDALSVGTTERQVDAALPKQVRLGRETTLLVLIRTPTAAGLREKLGAEPRDYEAAPEDVLVSPTFDVTFGEDEKTGRLRPGIVKIVIETKDFDIERTEENVQIRPQGDSVLCIFPLTPRKEGAARLLLSVLDNSEQKLTLTQLQLKSEVRSGEIFEIEYKVSDAAQVSDERATQLAYSNSLHEMKVNSELLRHFSQRTLAQREQLKEYTISLHQQLRQDFLSSENQNAFRNHIIRIATFLSEQPVESETQGTTQVVVALVQENLERLMNKQQYLNSTWNSRYSGERIDEAIESLVGSYRDMIGYLWHTLGRDTWKALLTATVAEGEGISPCPQCESTKIRYMLFDAYMRPYFGLRFACAACGYPQRHWGNRGTDYEENLRNLYQISRRYRDECAEQGEQAARIMSRLEVIPDKHKTTEAFYRISRELEGLQRQFRFAEYFYHEVRAYIDDPHYFRLLELESILNQDDEY
ncbi:MAG TPA: CHAT domain-containing protein [Pyrinomonadaceae bacterium]|jgi:hypothetical protein